MNASPKPRAMMIAGQLMPGEVLDPAILSAIAAVPREDFVPPGWAEAAYIDEDIPLGNGRWLMEPLTFSRLLALAKIKQEERVLEIGAATGYASAVLSYLAKHVVALEQDRVLATDASRELLRLERGNVEVICAPLTHGWPAGRPYDLVFFSGAVEAVPPALVEQLCEGGRMAAVLQLVRRPGMVRGLGKVAVGHKLHGRIQWRAVYDAFVPLLPGFEARKGFIF